VNLPPLPRRAAFVEENYPQFQHVLLRYLGKRVRSKSLAEDLASEVWLRLTASTSTGAIRKPLAFIYVTANRVLADHARQAKRDCVDCDSDLAETAAAIDERGFDRTSHAGEALQNLELVWACLPKHHRAIMALYLVEHATWTQIAERTGFTPGTAERFFYEAVKLSRKRFRQLMSGVRLELLDRKSPHSATREYP
jgi:RNA polymerase sigma factor (sigma-70 family)